MQRASALLRLGEDRQVLIATDHCVRLGQRHCLRTLASVLLLRAAANERLGHHQAADAAFGDAVGLLHRTGASHPPVALPRNETVALAVRLRGGRRGLDAAREALLGRLLATAAPLRVEPTGPVLTPREALIARELRGPGTLSQIAAALFVSRNTVKSQTRSLYRKLMVTNRADAVAQLERSGFFD